MNTLYLACALIVVIIGVFLIVHPDYEDGVIGRAAISTFVFGEFFVVYDYVLGIPHTALDTSALIQFGGTVFLMRHCYRFLRWRLNGEFAWRPARK